MSEHLDPEQPTDEPRESTASEDASTSGLRILVVDDNPGMVHLLTMFLNRLGSHTVESAGDGLSAWDKLPRFQPDLVLLDLMLPGLGGVEVARRIRRDARFKEMRIVAVTAHGGEDDRARALACGFDEYLVKPISLNDLREVLHRCETSSDGRPALPPATPREYSPEEPSTAEQRQLSLLTVTEGDGGDIPEFDLGALAHELGNTIVPWQIMLELLQRPHDAETTLATIREILEEQIPQMQELVESIRRQDRRR